MKMLLLQLSSIYNEGNKKCLIHKISIKINLKHQLYTFAAKE